MTAHPLIRLQARRVLAWLLLLAFAFGTLAPGFVAAASTTAKRPNCPPGKVAKRKKKRVRVSVRIRRHGKVLRRKRWVVRRVWVCAAAPAAQKVAADTQRPTTPAGLDAAAGNGQVTLIWGVASDNVAVTGYRVFRDGALLATTQSLSYKDTGLNNGSTYAYEVVAIDGAGNASVPATISATPKSGSDLTAPTAPPGFTATAGDRQVALSWGASTDNVGVVRYELFRDGTPIAAGTDRAFTDLSLVNGTTYSYKVVAYDAVGNVSSESTASGTPADTIAPATPTGLSAAPGDGQVSLTWGAATDNVAVAGYRVYRDDVLIASPVTSYYADTGLVNGMPHSYKVIAVDSSSNQSPATAPVSATPSPPLIPDNQAPSVPTGLAGSPATGQAILSWNASTDNVAVTGYKVYRGGVLVAMPAGPSYTDTGLTNGVAYSYTVAAVDASGNTSAQTAAVSVTPKDTQAPTTPTNLALTKNAAAHSITVTWTASTDNVGVVRYRVWRNGNLVGQPTGVTFTDADLANEATYTYTVAAVDAAGNVSAQAPAVATYVS